MTTIETLNRELVTIDRENAFLLYATFCGDLERTAHALNISATALLKLVEDEGWNKKLASIIELKKSDRPGDVERALNRALNYVQAHQMRQFVQRVIRRVTTMDEGEFEKYLLTQVDAKGIATSKLSTRALADLASAMEKAQAMTYLALNDTAQERIKRNEKDNGTSGGELHAAIARGMAEAQASTSPRAMLFDAQLQVAGEQRQAAKKAPPVPIDDTYEGDG